MFLYRRAARRGLHFFPTRRSSDLTAAGGSRKEKRARMPRPSGSAARSSPSRAKPAKRPVASRSEEHTSELQSHSDLVCRLLLEKKKQPPRRGLWRTVAAPH